MQCSCFSMTCLVLICFKVSNKKQRDSAAADAEMAAKRRGSDKENTDTSAPSDDVLGDEEDRDVIF